MVHEEHRVPNLGLIKKTFQAQEPRVRAAAIRTLGHWAGKLDGWEDTLLAAAKDASPLVRAEAVKAAVDLAGKDAAEAFFEVAVRELDPELTDVLAYAKGNLRVDEIIADTIRSGGKLSAAAEKLCTKECERRGSGQNRSIGRCLS